MYPDEVDDFEYHDEYDMDPNGDPMEPCDDEDDHDIEPDDDRWDGEEDLIDGVGFADPGGRSSLRAATRNNPRNLPCPTCGKPNRLTPLDRRRHYQCNQCADRAERGGY